MSYKKISGFKIILLILLVTIFFTGCTFYNKKEKPTTTEQEKEVLEVEAKTRSASLTITDKDGVETVIDFQFIDGENIYEILNAIILSNDNLKIEFDSFEMNGKEEISISSINSYNPTEDGKIWILKVNGEPSPDGMLNTQPKEGDRISLVLETIQ